MYFKHKIPENYSAIEDDGLDLRLRITNGEPELIAKLTGESLLIKRKVLYYKIIGDIKK